jgi:cytoplasmic iron level regulating protein YaaA (DUF328/UPF0246 family)
MKILLSPAKKLNSDNRGKCELSSLPLFPQKTGLLIDILQKYTPAELTKLMKISRQLAEMNYLRFREWHSPGTLSRQAIWLFDGAAYRGLQAHTLKDSSCKYLQENLRILSGLYGMLRPFDLIQPYRLEMGIRLQAGEDNNLYSFWKDLLTETLLSELHPNEPVINLTSVEYAKAIELSQLNGRLITPVFKEFKDGEYKVVSIYAKRARGLMTRYAAEHRITNPEELKTFNKEGYAYDDNLSNKNVWIFTRNKQ